MASDFYKRNDPLKALNEYGAPMYGYNEDITDNK